MDTNTNSIIIILNVCLAGLVAYFTNRITDRDKSEVIKENLRKEMMDTLKNFVSRGEYDGALKDIDRRLNSIERIGEARHIENTNKLDKIIDLVIERHRREQK